jgi:hypothetical protein
LRCTCGAYPPEDARFCHKCGRPLYESVVVEEETVKAPEPPLPPPLPKIREAVINFGNKTAVGVSVMAAAVTLLLLILLLLAIPNGAAAPLLFCAGGFLAAKLYTRASGETLTPQSGARMGFMTCLWGFLVVLIFVCVFAASISSPDFRHAVQLQMQQMQSSPELAKTASKTLDNPGELMTQLAVGVGIMFFIWTLLSMLGGILGARLSNRNPSNH